jgi:predicted RNase H-like HicB family nuclease
MASYIGLVRKIPESDFGVNFPDFPGCITAGETLDEAYRLAAEALAFHAEGMAEDGEALPEPSSLDAVMADPENRDAVPFMVPLALAPRVVRVNVTMDETLLRAIDAVAPNRSAFLAEGARRLLADRR